MFSKPTVFLGLCVLLLWHAAPSQSKGITCEELWTRFLDHSCNANRLTERCKRIYRRLGIKDCLEDALACSWHDVHNATADESETGGQLHMYVASLDACEELCEEESGCMSVDYNDHDCKWFASAPRTTWSNSGIHAVLNCVPY